MLFAFPITRSPDLPITRLLCRCHQNFGVVAAGVVLLRVEYLGYQFIAFTPDNHRVTNPDQIEELFYVLLGHAEAAMRGCLANGTGDVGPMNSVSFLAQAHPARAQRIALARLDHLALVVIGGV